MAKNRFTNFYSLLLFILLGFSFIYGANGGEKEYEKTNSLATVTGPHKTRTISLFNPVLQQNGTYNVGSFSGTINGDPANFFCIDLGHNLQWNTQYEDDGFTGSQITWILNNHFPHITNNPNALADDRDEAAAVQCAIWHFSDSLNINSISNNNTVKQRAIDIMNAAYANAGTTTPVNTLDIVPVSDQSLPYGTDAEFRVEAYDNDNNPVENAEVTIVTSSDGVLSSTTVYTDVNGQTPVITLSHNVDDNATITASADVVIPQGTRFVRTNGNAHLYQQLVLATPEFDTKEVDVEFMWVPEIDLEIAKSVDDPNPDDGDNITFTITVTNPSAFEATGVEVLDLLPDGYVFVSSNPANDYDENTGLWTVGSIAAGSSKTLEITVTVDYAALNAAPYTLGVAGDYNLFVWRDLTQPSSDTEGKVAVGRNAVLDNYSIGAVLPNSNGTEDVFVVGRKVTWGSGAVYAGNVVYGRFKDWGDQVSINNGTIRKDTVIDFTAAKNYLQNLSMTLSAYNVNGTTELNGVNLTLTGTDPFLNTFYVTAAQINAQQSLTINAPNGSVVLVNINGNNIEWKGGLHVYGTTKENVLFNFYRARNITIRNIDVTGSVLAPKATVDFTSGVQNGQMMAKSVTGQGQFNLAPFIGNVPIDPYLPNTAEIIALDQIDNNVNNDASQIVVQIQVIPNPNGGGGNGGGLNVNWTQIGAVQVDQIIWTMAEDVNNDLVAGTWGGKTLLSQDNGATWTEIGNNLSAAYIWSMVVKSNGDLYIGTENGVWMLDDYNGNWTKVALDGKDVRAFLIDPNDEDVMYAGTWGFGVYKSVDGGANWAEMNDMLGSVAVHALAMNSTGEVYCGTFDNGIYKYDANTSEWADLGIGYRYIWSLTINSNDDVYAGTYGGGVYYSDDDVNWYSVNSGLGGLYIYSVRVDGNDDIYVSTWASGVYKFTSNPVANNPMAWYNIGLNGFEVSSIYVNEETQQLIATTSDGQVFVGDLVTSVKEDEITGDLSYQLQQNYPNPFNPSTKIKFSVQEAGTYVLRVYNILGEMVQELHNGELAAGNYEISFQAEKLTSGIYIYQLEGNNVKMTRKMMLLK